MKPILQKTKWLILSSLLVAVVTSLYWNGWFFQNNCNVANISLRGGLYTYLPPDAYNDSGNLSHDAVSSENVVEALLKARDNKKIDAVLIVADSWGGELVAGEEIANAIKTVGKPVIAIAGAGAMSAAYYAISSADTIFASQYSDVGAIGITVSYVENVEKNRKEGLSFVELTSGKFKETANPDKSLTQEERQILQNQLNALHQLMIEDIAKNRHLPVERVKSLANGLTLTGVEAKELGLIDEVGTYFDALRWLENKIGNKAKICK